MLALDEKIARFCEEYRLSPQQRRIFAAIMRGTISNEALARRLGMRAGTLCKHLERMAEKTGTLSRAELFYLFYQGGRGE